MEQQFVYRSLQKLVHQGLLGLERSWAVTGGQREPMLNPKDLT